ncbi:unnamed protein product [Blepharisma stoltei]|uniref:Uncharacterized protein n=1 Tax=Blepharisma stoltei TaxID=1481888 RepID=A0AAU9IZJ4_9CILI|nr:unnamed protein product [Blepharisma stoltei]
MYQAEIEPILKVVLGKEEVPLKNYRSRKKLLDQWLVEVQQTRRYTYPKIEEMIAANTCDEEFARLYLTWITQLNENPKCGIPAPEKPKKPFSENPRSPYIIHKFIKIFESRDNEYMKAGMVKMLFHKHEETTRTNEAVLRVKIYYLHCARLVECYKKRVWMENFCKAQQLHKFHQQALLEPLKQNHEEMKEKRKKSFLSNILNAYYKRAMFTYFNAFASKCIKRKNKAILFKSMLVKNYLREKFKNFQLYKLQALEHKSAEQIKEIDKKNTEKVARIEKDNEQKRKLELISMLKMGINKRIAEAIFLWKNYVSEQKLNRSKDAKIIREWRNIARKYTKNGIIAAIKAVSNHKSSENNKNETIIRALYCCIQQHRLVLSKAISKWSRNIKDQENHTKTTENKILDSNNKDLKKQVKSLNDEMIGSKLSLSQKINDLMSQNLEKEKIQSELQKEVQSLLLENQHKDEEHKQIVSQQTVQAFKLLLMRRQMLFSSAFSKWKFETIKWKMQVENQNKAKLDKNNFAFLQKWHSMSAKRWTKIMSSAIHQLQANSRLIAHNRLLWNRLISRMCEFDNNRQKKYIRKWNEKVKESQMRTKFFFVSKALERRYIDMSATFKKFKTLLEAQHKIQHINQKNKIELLIRAYCKGMNINYYKFFSKFKLQLQKKHKKESLLLRALLHGEKTQKLALSKAVEKLKYNVLEKKKSDLLKIQAKKQARMDEEEKKAKKSLLEKRKMESLKHLLVKVKFSMKKAFDALAYETKKQIAVEKVEKKLDVQSRRIKYIQKWMDLAEFRKNSVKYFFGKYKFIATQFSNKVKKDEKMVRNVLGKLNKLVENKRLKEIGKKVMRRGAEQISELITNSFKKWKNNSKAVSEEKILEEVLIEPEELQPQRATKISHPSQKQMHKLGRSNDKSQKQKELILRRIVSVRSKLDNKSKIIEKLDTSFENSLCDLQQKIWLKATALSLLPKDLQKNSGNAELEKKFYINVIDQLKIRLNELTRKINFTRQEINELQQRKNELPDLLVSTRGECEVADEKIEKLKASIQYLKKPKIDWKDSNDTNKSLSPIKLKLENDNVIANEKPKKLESRFSKPITKQTADLNTQRQISLFEFAIISFIIGFSLSWLLGFHLIPHS